MYSHDIVNIVINGTAAATGIAWTAESLACASSLEDVACLTRWADLVHTDTPYTLTFQV